jgi:hypothetical protein
MNLPFHGFDQNRIWCAIVALAVEINGHLAGAQGIVMGGWSHSRVLANRGRSLMLAVIMGACIGGMGWLAHFVAGLG